MAQQMTGAQMVILLRFNQPIRTADVAPHVSAQFERHEWNPPAPGVNTAAWPCVFGLTEAMLARPSSRVTSTRPGSSRTENLVPRSVMRCPSTSTMNGLFAL